MPIKFENVGIAVRNIDETIAFFTDLGLTVLGRDTVSGEWADTAVGLDGNHAKVAVLQTRTATVASSCSSTSTPTRSRRTRPNPTRSGCTASRSRWTTSTRPSRSRRDTATSRCAAWRPT